MTTATHRTGTVDMRVDCGVLGLQEAVVAFNAKTSALGWSVEVRTASVKIDGSTLFITDTPSLREIEMRIENFLDATSQELH